MARGGRVERPRRKSEYELQFASRQAEKGWQDLKAVLGGPLVDTWEFLTKTPLERTPTNYPLKDELGAVTSAGVKYQRWQQKPTAQGDARIGIYVDGRVVFLEQVHTRHPNATK